MCRAQPISNHKGVYWCHKTVSNLSYPIQPFYSYGTKNSSVFTNIRRNNNLLQYIRKWNYNFIAIMTFDCTSKLIYGARTSATLTATIFFKKSITWEKKPSYLHWRSVLGAGRWVVVLPPTAVRPLDRERPLQGIGAGPRPLGPATAGPLEALQEITNSARRTGNRWAVRKSWSGRSGDRFDLPPRVMTYTSQPSDTGLYRSWHRASSSRRNRET
jgi:hypothetical protein